MMSTAEIEATVGRLYLTILDQQKVIADLKAQLPEPVEKPSAGPFSISREA